VLFFCGKIGYNIITTIKRAYKMKTLIKTATVPYYYQLKQILSEFIKIGELKIRPLSPPERGPCSRYQVSRITIRRALDLLMQEGLICRERGRGTFVTKPPLEQPSQIISFTEQMKSMGLKPSTRVLETRIISQDSELAERLLLRVEEEIISIKRLRLADNEPVALENSYLPHKIYPRILSEDLTGSLTRIVEDKYHWRLKNASQTVKAVNVSTEIAKILKIKSNSPVLYVSRISFLADNRPAEYLEAYYRGDRYKLTMELTGR